MTYTKIIKKLGVTKVQTAINPITTLILASLCGWFFCAFLAFSAETTLEIEQTTPDRQKAVQTAIQQLSQELMERLIEPSKLKAQKKRIQKIISTYSNRYILYTKTETPVAKGPKSFVLPIRIGFSEENLKKILLKEDLFYSGSSHLRILPLILFENKITKEVYAWWRKKNNNPSLINLDVSAFYSHIQQALLPYHFFVIHVEQAGSRYFVPSSLLSSKLSKKEKFKLSKFFQSHLIMIGDVIIRESDVDSFVNVKVQLSVFNTDSGRLLAEVERFEKIPLPEQSHQNQKATLKNKKAQTLDYMALFLKKETQFAKSLGSQLQLIYEEGQISSHVVKIQVKNTLSHGHLEQFKKELISKTPALTGLKEHIMAQESISYIANTSEGIEVLSQQIKSQVFSGFNVQVDRVRKNNIYIEVTLKK